MNTVLNPLFWLCVVLVLFVLLVAIQSWYARGGLRQVFRKTAEHRSFLLAREHADQEVEKHPVPDQVMSIFTGVILFALVALTATSLLWFLM